MKKSIRKVIALVLSLIMIMSVMAAGFSVFAEEPTPAEESTTAEEPTTEHAEGHLKTSFFQMFIDFFKEVFSFFKYIFYDVFRGRDPDPAPSLVY